MNATDARLALSIVEGLVRDAPGAEGVALDAFDSLEAAAVAHAYLAGFVLELLAEHAGVSPSDAAALVRLRLDRLA